MTLHSKNNNILKYNNFFTFYKINAREIVWFSGVISNLCLKLLYNQKFKAMSELRFKDKLQDQYDATKMHHNIMELT